ncbi:hypothetical protein [Mycobacterium sp. OAE908]|uniref:DUF6998 domain-containing protein n=1 Tax=Mycobacterium sp. OAE908 TaxID=2817899 RepID=UPI001AEB6A19
MSIDLADMSVRDLLAVWSGVAAELQRRGLTRTNSVVGELAEAIARQHYGGTLATSSTTGYDLETDDGELIQVKALWKSRPSRNKLGVIRGAHYDSVLAVEFDQGFTSATGYRVLRADVERMVRHQPHVNGREIVLTARFKADPAVETVDLSDAFNKVFSSTGPISPSDDDRE